MEQRASQETNQAIHEEQGDGEREREEEIEIKREREREKGRGRVKEGVEGRVGRRRLIHK